MRNNKGFTFIEALFSFSIIIIVTLSIFPTLLKVYLFMDDLSAERSMASTLHDELQYVSQNDVDLPVEMKKSSPSPTLYTFIQEDSYIKGCAELLYPYLSEVEICMYAVKQ
ncbi:type II secretion system GspH family protein [Halobacillus yeomjeoni]|uniref:Type II secretion system protein n=1 Tax=Halobacillus yeomjeoni TaxID=311194 RepID=A0A931MUS7_9BACI|nr:type II secretion system protein [Halobacillus yeomjeoni]MBH0229860.1 type II secretion system protein [Halobacillus yeomjeoni]MCA0982762.1 type II secretion system GspH family protein [Halobacillus yeomjeoni]